MYWRLSSLSAILLNAIPLNAFPLNSIPLNAIPLSLIMHKTMLSYCLKCKKRNTGNINQRVSKTKNGKIMILSKCAICGSNKSKFIKEQEAKGLLGNLGIRIPLSKIPILVDIFFLKYSSVKCNWVQPR